MPKLPAGISEDELYAILTATKGPTRMRNFRLSEEAQRILAAESERFGIDETKTVELLLREIRELRKQEAAKKPKR